MFNKFMLPVVLLGSLLLGSLSVFVGRADGQVAVAPEVKPAWLTELSAGLKESYDSSVFLSGVDPRYLPPGYVVPAGSVAALRDRSSWLTTVSPRVGVNLAPLTGVTWLQGLTLGYAPEVVRYQATPSEDYAAQRFTAGLQAKGEGWSAGAEEAFTFINGSKYGPTYPGNYITAYNIAAVRERREQIQDRLALTGRYDLGRWFVRPTASLLDYDLMTKALSSTVYPGYMNYGSRYDVNGGLDGGYQLTSGLAATLGYRYGHQYQEQFSFMPFRADNDYQRVLAGLEGKPWSWLSVKLQGGPDFRNYNGLTPVRDQNLVTYYGEASLTATLSPADVVTFKYKQWQWVSSTGKVPYFDGTYDLGYHRALTQQLGLDLGGRLLTADYNSGDLTACARDDWQYTVSAGLGWAFNAHASMSVGYALNLGRNDERGVVNPETRDYDEAMVSVGVVLKY